MVQHAELTRDTAAQAVTPSDLAEDQLGTSGANITVAAGVASSQGDPAPRTGILIVGMAAGMSARVRIGNNPTALITDARYVGPNVWHFPIIRGNQISFFGDAGITTDTITVCMAKG